MTDEVFTVEETDLEPPPTALPLSAVHRMVLAASLGAARHLQIARAWDLRWWTLLPLRRLAASMPLSTS